MKEKLPSEHAEQVTLINWFRKAFPGVRIFAIPNGGFRDQNTAKKLKAEGSCPGVPDLQIPEWHLWVEMKRQKGGTLSAHQKEWIEYLEGIGQRVIVGRGFEDAKRQILELNK